MNVKLTDKEKIQVSCPDDLFGIMQRILLRENRIDREKEHLWMVGMNVAGVILYIELISMGSVRSTVVEPMNVYRVAILKGATRVIAVHNHPGGAMKPSKRDEDVTDRLIQVGKIIDIAFEDHLIINPDRYVSFKAIGLMDILGKSLKYVPPYIIIEKMKEEEKAIRKEAVKDAVLNFKNTMVDNLFKNNLTIEQIANILQLTPEEVTRIGNPEGEVIK